MFDDYFKTHSVADDKRNSLVGFISQKQKAFKGFLARKSLRDQTSEMLMQQFAPLFAQVLI